MVLPKTTALATFPGAVKSLDFRDAYEPNGTALRNRAAPLRPPLERGCERESAAAFYLGGGVDPGQPLGDGPCRIDIGYLWSIPAEAFASDALMEIRRTVDAPTLDRILPPIERRGSLYADVEPGNSYSLTSVPGVGTERVLDGEAVGLIEGKDFSMPVFSIWIGKRPVDEKLYRKSLSRSRRM